MDNDGKRSLYEEMMLMYDREDEAAEAEENTDAKASENDAEKTPQKPLNAESYEQLDIMIQRVSMSVNDYKRQKESFVKDADAIYSKLRRMKDELSATRIFFCAWIASWIFFILIFKAMKKATEAPMVLMDAILIIAVVLLISLAKITVLPFLKANLTYRIYAADPKYSYFINQEFLSTIKREHEYYSKSIATIESRMKKYKTIQEKLEKNEMLSDEEKEICCKRADYLIPAYTFREYKYRLFDSIRNIILVIKGTV